MGRDYLDDWREKYPTFVGQGLTSEVERYMRGTPPRRVEERVSDDVWNEIVTRLTQ